MRLRELELHYFRQHVASRFEFPEGLIGILGSNGAGKTTLVEAIVFALFGSKSLRGKIEDVRTRGKAAREGVATRVRLVLEHDGVVWSVDRSLTDASLRAGGEAQPVAKGGREVTERITQLLGMNHQEFIATYCTEQKGLEFLKGFRGGTEREKFIARVLGYDRLERLQEAVREDRKELRGQLAALDGALQSKAELAKLLEQDLVGVTHHEREVAEAGRVLAEGERTAEEATTRFRDIEARKQEVAPLERECQRLRGACRAKEEELTRLAARVASISVAEANPPSGEQLAAWREELLAARGEIGTISATWIRSQTTTSEELRRLEQELRSIEERLRQRDSLPASEPCPQCGQELGVTFGELRAHLEEESRKLVATIQAAQRQGAELARRPDALTRAEERVTALEARLAEGEALVRAVEERRQAEELQGACRAELVTLQGSLTLQEEELHRRGVREEDFLARKSAMESANRFLEVTRLQKVRADGALATARALVERRRQELLRLDQQLATVQRLRDDLFVLDESDLVLTEFRRALNERIRPRLSEIASEFITDLTDGRYTMVEMGEDFSPTVIEDGAPKPVLSGGEEDLLHLCVRLALSQMIAERAGQSLSFLILDEVFGSLDETRRMNVLQLLERLRGRFEQVLLISHLPDVREALEHVVYVDFDEGAGVAAVVESSGYAFAEGF